MGLLLLLPSWLAEADTSLVATGAVDTGYSTNIQGVAESDDPMAPEVVADSFMNLRPGLAAAYELPRAIHNLNYIFGAQLFLSNSEANSFSNTLTYQSLLTMSARSSLRLGAAFNAGRVNSFDQPGVQVGQPGEVVPDGDVEFIAYNANAAYRRLLSQVWTGEVTVAAAKFDPTNTEDVGSTTNLEQRVRIERSFRYHLLGADARLAFNRQAVPDVQRSLTSGPGVFWTWNVTESISTNTTAGVDVVGEYPAFARGFTVPRGSAALTYSHERGRATAGWARGAATNIFGGDTTVNNNFFLNAALPLPTTRPIALTAALNYATGEIIDLEIGDTRGRTKLMSADVGVALALNRAWNLGIRGQTSKQTLEDITEMGTFNSTIRQTIGSVVLQGRFPAEIAAQVPRQSSDRVESGNASFETAATPQAPGGSGGGGGGGGGNE
jgi:hypothetical protein